MLSTRRRWFTCVRLSDPHLTRSRRAFSLTLTTGALDPSRSRWFGACLRRPAPRGLPSSQTHIAWRTSSSPGEFHPQALTEPDGSLSTHPALITRPMAASSRQVPPNRLVDPTIRLGDWAPSLHAHYRHFDATTSPSAPVPRIGTLALVGPPLGLLPSHRGDRFPGSMFEPGADSRHLHAERHAGSKRISPALIPEQRLNPGFDVIHTLSTRRRWFTCVRLSDPHLTQSRRAFSLTLTTGALDPSRSRWFGACLRRPAPRGLPSSRTYIAWRTVVGIAHHREACSRHQMVERVEIDVAQQRAQDRPLGRACRGVPSLQAVQDVRLQERFDQRQHRAVGDLPSQAPHQAVVRDRVEVAFQVGVNHVNIS